VHQTTTVGAEFASALAAKDSSRMLDLLRIEWMRVLCSGYRPATAAE
jgi:hypothetical protein